ncbi:NAD-dependent epimerase/dehydratase family protein [Bremerella sp.]|uniref:NAD-dependent epimerase/dehydratase family protein n=1 Tax=Bremerella sp. TaxID=2795602 RepID=UPI00391A3EBA
MAKVFVTGGRGFLGTRLVDQLRSQGHEVTAPTSLECDLTVQGALDTFNSTSFDRIIHLAAWTQAGDFCLRHPGEQWIINQTLNTNVLTWWNASQRQAKLVSMGTSCAYSPDLPLREENYLEGRPIESLFAYAMAKRMLYAGQLALGKQFDQRSLTLVPSTLYGPGYHTDGRQMHFIFDLIRKILRARHYGEQVTLWGDGNQKREIVHVDDFVRIGLHLMDDCPYDLVNVGAGDEFSIRHFAQLICELVDYDPARIEYDTSRYVGARSKTLDIERMHELVPEPNLIDLKEGLRTTIDWFLENKATVLPE